MARWLWEAIKKVGRDIDDQVWNRSGPHGAAELGAVLYGNGGSAYVMYGHGGRQDQPAGDRDQQPRSDPEPEPEQERSGRER